MIEKFAQPGEGGRCTISTITYKVAVYATDERAEILPLFLLYPLYVLCGYVTNMFRFSFSLVSSFSPVYPNIPGRFSEQLLCHRRLSESRNKLPEEATGRILTM
jgi:hypothetical protein